MASLDPFADIGQLAWEPFDVYKTPSGQLKDGTEDYFHPPLSSAAVEPFVNDDGSQPPLLMPVDVQTVAEFQTNTTPSTTAAPAAQKPLLVRGGSILGIGENMPSAAPAPTGGRDLLNISEAEVVGQPNNPFLSPQFAIPASTDQEYNRPEDWDFFLDNESEKTPRADKPAVEPPKVVTEVKKSSVPKKKKSKKAKASSGSSTEKDALNGLLEILVMDGKNFPDAKHKVAVSIKGKPDYGTGVSDVSGGTTPNFYQMFHVQIADKGTDRIAFELQTEAGSKLYSRTLNVRSLPPNEKRSIWLAMSEKDSSAGEIHISVTWIPKGHLPLMKHDKSRVRLQPRLSVKLNSDVIKAGTVIQGKVRLLVGKPISYTKGISVRFLGQEHVSFITFIDGERVPVREHRKIIEKATVLEKNMTDSTKTWAAGSYSWKFKISVPAATPPGYASKFGFIRYVITASVDGLKKHSYTLPIQLHTPLDTKISPKDQDHIYKVSQNHHVSLHITIGAWIHQLGNPISLKLRTENLSHHILGKLKIRLFEKTTIRSNGLRPVVNTRVLAARIIKDVCGPNSEWKKEFNVSLPTKYRQQSVLKSMGTKYISVDHYLEFKSGKTALLHKHKQKVQVPVVLVHEKPETDE
mmetsp:Transcript_19841/g.22077  ORF Transcript_19841/g.22077 Transcript_19841/m.22077 type:complete len:634 (+) Transcript_19841:75-1976(+)